jgi:anti-anti-sigma factor
MSAATPFELTLEDVDDDVRIISVLGEADRFRTQPVTAAIEAARDAGRRPIVELSDVTFIDSSMIAALVASSEQGRRRSEPLVILCTAARLKRSLQLKGLETILVIADTRDEALALAAEQPPAATDKPD